jgi:hypothetical protein
MQEGQNDLCHIVELSLIHHRITTLSNFELLACSSDNRIRHGCQGGTVGIKKLK